MELVGCEMGEGRKTGWGRGADGSREVWNFTSTLSICLLEMVLRNGGSLTWLLLL